MKNPGMSETYQGCVLFLISLNLKIPTMKKLMCLLAITILIGTGCSKKDKTESCPVTKESVAGSYRLVTFKMNGVDALDVTFQACQKDDIVTLKADGTYDYTDAGVSCDPSANSTGNWTLSGNTFTIDYFPFPLTIKSFDCSNLSGTAVYSGVNIEATFRKQ